MKKAFFLLVVLCSFMTSAYADVMASVNPKILTISEAISGKYVHPCVYTWDGYEYVIISVDDLSPDIGVWQGFWIVVKQEVDLLFPPVIGPLNNELRLKMTGGGHLDDPEGHVDCGWYFISSPIMPDNGNIVNAFSALGTVNVDWQIAKIDYKKPGGYMFFPDKYSTGEAFPDLQPGRGFWIQQVNGKEITVEIEGVPVPLDVQYELKLPMRIINGNTFHMAGNPFGCPIRWKNLKVRIPMTSNNPLAKVVAENFENAEKWFVGVKLEALDGSARDTYNRAGVVTTPGVDNTFFNAFDMVPPGSFINVTLNNPSDVNQSGLAYDFRPIESSDYRWEITLSTNFSSKSVRLSLNNLANVPKDVNLTLKDMSTGEEFSVDSDYSLSLILQSGVTRKFMLSAKPNTSTHATEIRPASFGISIAAPNPFNPTTTITYNIDRQSNVKLSVFSVNGQFVESLVNGSIAPGSHSAVWNAKNRSSGVYFVVLEANGKRDTLKVSLVK